MKILLISTLGQWEMRDVSFIPRAGDKVDVFYHPYPTVTTVLAFPRLDTLKNLGVSAPVDAVVTVE